MRPALVVLLAVAPACEPRGARDAGALPSVPAAPLLAASRPHREIFAQRVELPRDEQLFSLTTRHTAGFARLADEALDASLSAGEQVDLERFFYDFYRLRDPVTLPTHRVVAREGPNPLQQLWSIALLGELGSRATDLETVHGMAADPRPLVREVAANALGRLATIADEALLEDLRAREENDYVRATFEAALARVRQPRALSVTRPVLADTARRRLRFFFNGGIEAGEHFERQAERLPPTPLADGFVFPHQQFRFAILGAPPVPNFGGVTSHVGEDSGWFLQGLPVHAMAAGVVCRVLFDRSWGSLIAVEHRLEGGELVTSYYAHLHHDLDVAPGDVVTRGQKLGEIGPATSSENGGYWPHLHTGLERSPCATARVAGYDVRLERYADPLWFVLDHPPGGASEGAAVDARAR